THLIRQVDADLGVGVESLTALAAEPKANCDEGVRGDPIVDVERPGHRVSDAMHVLMLDRRDQLTGKIVFHGDTIDLSCGGHALNLTGGLRPCNAAAR